MSLNHPSHSIYYCMTHHVQLIHSTPNGDDLIAHMARVSNPANQNNSETAPKLIKYLIKHHHWSPFEMVSMCVKIKTTRSVAAQILRHRSFSFQEFSQRYAEVTDQPVAPQLRRQDDKNRQNSIDDIREGTKEIFNMQIDKHFDEAVALYNTMLKAGIAKECARDVLPMGSQTVLYMHGTVRSWIHYCLLRMDESTQLEHRLVAQGCYNLLVQEYPSVCAGLPEKNDIN